MTSSRHSPAWLIALACALLLVGGTWWAGGFDVALRASFGCPWAPR
ncbi:MAG: hypothetical protein R2742_05585 [Micropruina glycogenica]